MANRNVAKLREEQQHDVKCLIRGCFSGDLKSGTLSAGAKLSSTGGS